MKKITLFIFCILMIYSLESCMDDNDCVEICDNGIDDDMDGKVDCEDEECADFNFNISPSTKNRRCELPENPPNYFPFDGGIVEVRHPHSGYNSQIKNSLVIALHGYGSDNVKELSLNALKHRNVHQEKDFILVEPKTDGSAWNSRHDISPSHPNHADSLKNLIEELKCNYNIDENRIILLGISNGAAMALRLGCEYPDLISSIICHSGTLYYSVGDCDYSSKGPDVLLMHGENDPIVRYYGDTVFTRIYPGAEETLKTFKTLAQNSATELSIENSSFVYNIDTLPINYIDRLFYEPYCGDSDTKTELWKILNGDHTSFPSKETAERYLNWADITE